MIDREEVSKIIDANLIKRLKEEKHSLQKSRAGMFGALENYRKRYDGVKEVNKSQAEVILRLHKVIEGVQKILEDSEDSRDRALAYIKVMR